MSSVYNIRIQLQINFLKLIYLSLIFAMSGDSDW